jgi:hypothetical protein
LVDPGKQSFPLTFTTVPGGPDVGETVNGEADEIAAPAPPVENPRATRPVATTESARARRCAVLTTLNLRTRYSGLAREYRHMGGPGFNGSPKLPVTFGARPVDNCNSPRRKDL